MGFSAEQMAALGAALAKDRGAARKIQGRDVRYLEGWDVLAAANRIFGFDGWGYAVTRLDCQGGVWVALVRLMVSAGGDEIAREDVGVGIPAVARGAESASAEATETAIKGAVTDALKRALRGFGDQFGLSLYDKEGDGGQPSRTNAPKEGQVVVADAPAHPPGIGLERAGKLGGLIHASMVRQGADDLYAERWIAAQLRRAGLPHLSELGEAGARTLLEQAAQVDVTRPADGGR